MKRNSIGLNERVVVITGANGGLGGVVAHHFADMGASLALVGTSAEKLSVLERELNLVKNRILQITADLSQPESAQNILEAVLEKFGRADILLHLVGGWIEGMPVNKVTPNDINAMLQPHLWMTFYLARVFGPHMVANGWGRMIIVSSPSATLPPANVAPYAIGKSAQEALILSLAEELKGTGVTANILHVRAIDVKHERDSQPSPQTASWTTPEEIAGAIHYLCTNEAGMVNGARIPLFGG